MKLTNGAPGKLLFLGFIAAIVGSASMTTAQLRPSRRIAPVIVREFDPSIMARAIILENRVSVLPATKLRCCADRNCPTRPA